MRVVLQAARFGALRGADLELTPGRYVALSNEREPLRDLTALLAAREAPRSGRVWFDGASAVGRPALRRKLAALLPDESLPPAKTVQQSVMKALAARGDTSAERAAALLESAGISHLAALAPRALAERDRRSVALSLALSHDAAEVFVLDEPLASHVPAAFVLTRLDQHTARGAVVLAVTTSPADAIALGGSWLCVELGRVRAAVTPRLGAGPWQQVLIETRDARELSRLLHESAHHLATELGASPRSLKVTGPALEVTVREVVALARQHGLEIERIEAAVPPVESLLAARAGFARGAYEAARTAALAPAPYSAPANPGGSA